MDSEETLLDGHGPSSTEFGLEPEIPEPVKVVNVPNPPFLDFTADSESQVLLRYDNLYRALAKAGHPLDGSVAPRSVVDWSINFALQGKAYFEQQRAQQNYNVLRSCLLLIVAAGGYVNPPDFGDSNMDNMFLNAIGFSAVSSLISIISYNIFSICVYRPYSLIDSILASVRNNFMSIIGSIFDYLGMLTLLIALLLARTGTAGSVAQPMAVLLFLLILTMWTWAMIYTDEVLTIKRQSFLFRYLDRATGQLTDGALRKIYRPENLLQFLDYIDQHQHFDKFEGFDLDSVLLMEKADLMDLFQVPAFVAKKDAPSPEQKMARLMILNDIRNIYEEIGRVKKLPNRNNM